jgi:hypothetical protein
VAGLRRRARCVADGRYGVLVADESGKGEGAAFIMAVSRTVLLDLAMTGDSPAQVMANPRGDDSHEYDIYPPGLGEPYRTRRFKAGEDLYATLGIPREDKTARLLQLARNYDFFGAPVGLFFYLDRSLGPPQWSDVGMYMRR